MYICDWLGHGEKQIPSSLVVSRGLYSQQLTKQKQVEFSATSSLSTFIESRNNTSSCHCFVLLVTLHHSLRIRQKMRTYDTLRLQTTWPSLRPDMC